MKNSESAQTEWAKVAETVGFQSEAAMWQQLYGVEGRSIGELAKVMGYGTATIARRLSLCEVEKRKRGGSHNPSQVAIMLGRLDQRIVHLSTAKELAQLLGASPHSIYRVMKELA